MLWKNHPQVQDLAHSDEEGKICVQDGVHGLYISHLFFLNIDGECMRTYYIILYKFSRLNFFQLNLKKVNNWYVACNRHLITIILILIKLKNLTELTKSMYYFSACAYIYFSTNIC